jgi:hypothetical protein
MRGLQVEYEKSPPRLQWYFAVAASSEKPETRFDRAATWMVRPQYQIRIARYLAHAARILVKRVSAAPVAVWARQAGANAF